MSETERPLVTFALFAYNQEKYVREAVQSALTQDYENMEVIISDDCSKDFTFKIIEEFVKKYTGTKKVIVSRNENNLGLIDHVNKVVSMCSGELIIVAAGDDISHPHRSSMIVQRWLTENKKVDSIHSSVTKITDTGEEISAWSTPLCNSSSTLDFIKYPIIIGASHAWTKRIFDFYGKLQSGVFREDRVIGLRSAMRGGVSFIKEPLVKYRISGMSNTGYGVDNARLREVETKMRLAELNQNFLDAIKVANISSELLDAIGNECKFVVEKFIVSNERVDPSRFFLKRLIAISKVYLKHLIEKNAPLILQLRLKMKSWLA